MANLREITKTFLRFSGRPDSRPSTGDHPPTSDTEPDTVVPSDPYQGRQFGAYRILTPLGAGGMGHVYLALDTRLERQVALKFLSPQLTADPRSLLRLQQEARTASALNHPNILTIYEIGELAGEYFIASEYIDGATLRLALQREEIDLAKAIDIAGQVASALMAAHSAGVVHRDLKPGNIMIRRDGYVKVIDFGLAKHVRAAKDSSADLSLTLPGSVIGTLDYMSPEQARGDEVDHRTDLWSLGVVLYEMIARKRPFEGQTESHVIVSILDHPLPPLPDVKSLPAGLPAIITRALAKDPAQRYQTAGEMLADLRQISPVSTRIIQPPRPRPRSGSRKKLILAGIAAVILVAWAVWWWSFQGRYFFVHPNWFEFGAPQRVTSDGNVHLAAISPDGQYLAYIAGDGTLRIRQLSNASETRLPVTPDECIGLTFSPNSSSLYYVLKNRKHLFGTLYSIAIPTGAPALVLPDVDGPVTFSPDGQQFAYLRRREEPGGPSQDSIVLASAANADNGHPLVSLTGTEIKEQLAWSPRGETIAGIIFAHQLNNPTRPAVALFSASTGKHRLFSPAHLRRLSFPTWLSRDQLVVFSGLSQNSEQARLEQLFAPTGEWKELPGNTLAFTSVSATRDGRTLAAVASDQRSSIWVADSGNLDAARQLTQDSERIDSLSWSDRGAIVFPSARNGSVNLWRIDSTGAAQPLPGAEACVEEWPAQVPGQPIIIYSSNCATVGDDFNLWSVNAQTGRRIQLTSGSSFDEQPVVSPDGQWIFYTSWPSNTTSIWKIPVSGGTPARVSAEQAGFPAVSPDGTKLLCQIREPDGLLRVAILSTENGTVLQQFPALPIDHPARWSPDGSAVDFIDSRNGSANLWRQPLAGGSPRQLTHFIDSSIIYFAWNPNGTKLAYIRGRQASDVVLFHRSARP